MQRRQTIVHGSVPLAVRRAPVKVETLTFTLAAGADHPLVVDKRYTLQAADASAFCWVYNGVSLPATVSLTLRDGDVGTLRNTGATAAMLQLVVSRLPVEQVASVAPAMNPVDFYTPAELRALATEVGKKIYTTVCTQSRFSRPLHFTLGAQLAETGLLQDLCARFADCYLAAEITRADDVYNVALTKTLLQ